MFVDTQRRIFGRWNIIDLIFLTLIGFVLACGGAAGGRWLFLSTAPLPVKTIEVDLVFSGQTRPELGEQLFDRKQKSIGEVINITGATTSLVTVRLNVPCKENVLKVNGLWVGIGSSVVLRNGKKTYRATIEDIAAEPRVWVHGLVRCLTVLPELALIIKDGDSQVNAHGRVIARISKILRDDVRKVHILEASAADATTELVEMQTDLREVLLSLDMLVSQKDGEYLFKGKPLRIGQTITVDTAVYSITGQFVQLTTLDGQPLLPSS